MEAVDSTREIDKRKSMVNYTSQDSTSSAIYHRLIEGCYDGRDLDLDQGQNCCISKIKMAANETIALGKYDVDRVKGEGSGW